MKEKIRVIAIDRIRILNPRHRDPRKFQAIVESIQNLGLKKPIKVSLRGRGETADQGYDLVAGQGRIEACLALGHQEIPAIVVSISKEDRLLMSLVENLARRLPNPMDLMREIERLKAAGYSNAAIGRKLDIEDNFVGGLIRLMDAGEERVLDAAIKKKIPLGVAIDIVNAKDGEAQRSLLKAYETGKLNKAAIKTVTRLIGYRRYLGKELIHYTNRKGKTTAESLVSAYRRESDRQKTLIRKAKITETKLLFITAAFKKFMQDDNFINLLRAEKLSTMPANLAANLKVTAEAEK